MKDLNLLKKLTEGFGVSGFEDDIRNLIIHEFDGLNVKIEKDGLGSLLIHYQSDPTLPHIGYFTHIDEVGFIINKIEENGFIRFTNLGGFNRKIMLSERVLLKTNENKLIPGLISSDIIENFDSFSNFYIDIGAKSKEEILSLGLDIGSPIEFDSKFKVLRNSLFMCKALDDRICAYSLIIALKKMIKDNLKANVTAVFTVQEEVGCRGANASSSLLDLDLGFALDVTDSFDIYDGNPLSSCRVNNGVALSIIDGGTIAHRGLLKFLTNLFNKKKFKFTIDPMDVGGTDSSKIHISKRGVINLTISLPVRYMHSPNTIGSIEDASNLSKAILLITNNIKLSDVENIKDYKFNNYK